MLACVAIVYNSLLTINLQMSALSISSSESYKSFEMYAQGSKLPASANQMQFRAWKVRIDAQLKAYNLMNVVYDKKRVVRSISNELNQEKDSQVFNESLSKTQSKSVNSKDMDEAEETIKVIKVKQNKAYLLIVLKKRQQCEE